MEVGFAQALFFLLVCAAALALRPLVLRSVARGRRPALRMSNMVHFDTIAVSGTAVKAFNFVDISMVNHLFAKKAAENYRVVTDDVKFARKRIVTPKSVYSGLIDVVNFYELPVDLPSAEALRDAIKGADAWLAFNVSSAAVKDYVQLAAQTEGLKRLLLAVNVNGNDAEAHAALEADLTAANTTLLHANIDYTVLRFDSRHVRELDESKFPFRVVPGTEELPQPLNNDVNKHPLAAGDLLRFAAEAINLPVGFNKMYGLGPGSFFEAEMLTYMRAQGLSEEAQAWALLDGVMRKLELDYINIAERAGTDYERKKSKPARATHYKGIPIIDV